MFNLYAYPATVTKDKSGRFLVRFSDLKGAVTDGATLEEALNEASDALSEALMAAIDAKEVIPAPSIASRKQYLVTPDPNVALKVALHAVTRAQKIRPSDLARKLKIDHKDARRLFDAHHKSKLSSLYDALHSLGVRVAIGIEQRAA